MGLACKATPLRRVTDRRPAGSNGERLGFALDAFYILQLAKPSGIQ